MDGTLNESQYRKIFLGTCTSSEDTDQLAHSCSLIRLFTGHVLEFLYADNEDADRAMQMIYSRLSLSRTPRDSLKYFEISVLRHIRFAELRKN